MEIGLFLVVGLAMIALAVLFSGSKEKDGDKHKRRPNSEGKTKSSKAGNGTETDAAPPIASVKSTLKIPPPSVQRIEAVSPKDLR